MICPVCGAEVPESKTCANCGNPLLATGRFADIHDGYPDDSYVRASDDGYWETSIFEVQSAHPDMPGTPSLESFVDGLAPVDDAETAHSPALGAAPVGDAAGSGSSNSDEQHVEKRKASKSALVLVIVGLVLSVLLFTCIPGIICSIIGLVLNVRNNRPDVDNPRRVPVTVVGVIGLIVGAVSLVAFISMAMVFKQVLDVVDENGWDLARVQVIQGADGTIVVREHEGATAGSTPIGIVASSSSSAAPSAESSQSTPAESSSSTSSLGSVSAETLSLFAPECLDALGNPSLYALLELNGKDLQVLLEADGYKRYDEIGAWMRANSTVFEAINSNGPVSSADINRYEHGVASAPVLYMLSVKGYGTPGAALDGLCLGIGVESRFEDDGALFAIVRGTDGSRALALIATTGDSEQTVLLYGEPSIESGLFRDTIGIDVGSTIDEAWTVIAG